MKKIIYTIWKYTPLFLQKVVTKSIAYIYLKQVRIGRNVNISLYSILQKEVTIGRGGFIGKNTNISCLVGSKITIGNYTSIAQDCFIINYNHVKDFINTNNIPGLHLPERKIGKDIHIGHNVWIGTKSVILPGVSIGNGAIIGAGSVVTKDVKKYSVVGGVPAKHIKFRFSKELIKTIEKIDWYNWSLEKIKENKKLFALKITDKNIGEII